MTTKQNPKDIRDTMMCVYMNGNSKTALEFNTYSFFCFSFVGNTTVSVRRLDAFRGDFELTQKIPTPTIRASTVRDALYFSADGSLDYPRGRAPTLWAFTLPPG